MPYKDPVVAKQKAKERGERRKERERQRRIAAGLPVDGRGKHGNQGRGDKCGKWNPGRIFNSQGYVLVRVSKDHPLHIANGYALEHRMVMSEYLGRWIQENEHVHHKNGVKDDNCIENLELITKAEHNKIHMEGRRDEKTGRLL